MEKLPEHIGQIIITLDRSTERVKIEVKALALEDVEALANILIADVHKKRNLQIDKPSEN